MTLGAIQLPQDEIRTVSLKIRTLKDRYNCHGELKWTKVSTKNILFYLQLIDLFINEPNFHFRSLIVHDKVKLDHKKFNDGEHDNFYYKMYYELLKNIIENKPEDIFSIYLDIKDTQSSQKVNKLHHVLSNKFYDNYKEKVTKIQQIRSHESNILQLCDFLLGAVTFANRKGLKSSAKMQISEFLSLQTGYCLQKTTPPWEIKFNLFHFTPQTRI